MSDKAGSTHPKPPFPEQSQPTPGVTDKMSPLPDHGEESYNGHGRLSGRAAIITGGDSGIGRAVAIAFAREGADVVVSYLNEEQDAAETAGWIEKAGRRAILIPGDIKEEAHCRSIVERAYSELGRLDVLVNNAAHQMTVNSLEELTSEEWDITFRTNVYAMFHLCKAAIPRMQPGSAIINTSSINATDPRQASSPMQRRRERLQTSRPDWRDL